MENGQADSVVNREFVVNQDLVEQLNLPEKRSVSDLTHGLSDKFGVESTSPTKAASLSRTVSQVTSSDSMSDNMSDTDDFDLTVLYPFGDPSNHGDSNQFVLLKATKDFLMNDKKVPLSFFIFHVFQLDMFVFDAEIKSCVTEDRQYGGSEKLRAKVWLRSLKALKCDETTLRQHSVYTQFTEDEFESFKKVLEDEGVFSAYNAAAPSMIPLTELKKWSTSPTLKLFANSTVRWNKDCCLDSVINRLGQLKNEFNAQPESDSDSESESDAQPESE